MFEKAFIPVEDVRGFGQLQARLDAAFSPSRVDLFLAQLSAKKVRIRDFSAVLRNGLLGKDAAALYDALPVSDQAQTRERYLSLIEKVPGELRQRFLKLYAYY